MILVAGFVYLTTPKKNSEKLKRTTGGNNYDFQLKMFGIYKTLRTVPFEISTEKRVDHR